MAEKSSSTLLPFPTPPRRPDGIQIVYENLLDDLRETRPSAVYGTTDHLDIETAADHLQSVLWSVARYAKAVIGNLNYFANTNIPDETGGLVDAVTEVLCALRHKADSMSIGED